ncbi:MAG: hypothetical protein GY815_15985 [Gammaproteobacteria bacterium]|nr:hypothetical protein [Gammaproteobacteria bacterium]
MPYYLYKITSRDSLELVKRLQLLEVHEVFRAAKNEARRLRAEQPLEGVRYKVMFAESRLTAEEKLLEKREKPVLMEYER